MNSYPSRDQFFAHKFVRLLHKAAVASEIGRDAFAIIVVVAHTEDAMRYRGPAKFWNSQLIETLGFTKWDQFDKARRKAVEAGWLSYSGDGKRTSGEYFVTVPDGYEQISDSPIETTCTVVNPENGYDEGYKAGYKQGMIEGTNRVQCGVQTGDEQGEPSNPIPFPCPIPVPEEEQGDLAIPDAVASPSCPANYIAEQFCATFGGSISVTATRKKHLAARWRDPGWRENWQQALELAASMPFFRGDNDRGWRITFDFFIRPDSVAKIIEGNYSNGKPQQRKTSAEQREELNASSFDWIRQAAAEAAGGGREGLGVPSGARETLFLEEHGPTDRTRC